MSLSTWRSQAILLASRTAGQVLSGLRANFCGQTYERAYTEGRCGLGRPVKVSADGVELMTMGGVSLDLRLGLPGERRIDGSRTPATTRAGRADPHDG